MKQVKVFLSLLLLLPLLFVGAQTPVINSSAPLAQAFASYSGTTSPAQPILTYTPSNGGFFSVCAYGSMTAGGTGGTFAFQYLWAGGNFATNATNLVNAASSGNWGGNNCVAVYSPAGQYVAVNLLANSVTGSPTIQYSVTIQSLNGKQ